MKFFVPASLPASRTRFFPRRRYFDKSGTAHVSSSFILLKKKKICQSLNNFVSSQSRFTVDVLQTSYFSQWMKNLHIFQAMNVFSCLTNWQECQSLVIKKN